VGRIPGDQAVQKPSQEPQGELGGDAKHVCGAVLEVRALVLELVGLGAKPLLKRQERIGGPGDDTSGRRKAVAEVSMIGGCGRIDPIGQCAA